MEEHKTSILSVHISSEDEVVIRGIEGARLGMLCSFGNKATISMNERR